MLEIKGVLKHYDWGGKHFIPMATGVDYGGGLPVSEYWLGDHAGGAALLPDGTTLAEWIQENPVRCLGAKSIENFGSRLPYLFKILDVKSPLSIQVHPSLSQAKSGFAREQKLQIPPEKRNYKDNNHKPELMLALSDFWLLHGFKNNADLYELLLKEPELKRLAGILDAKGLKALVKTVFSLSQQELDDILCSLTRRYRLPYEKSELSRMNPFYWLMKAVTLAEQQGRDSEPGMIMVLLLNLVYVPKGGVVFQGAGIPHAYLEGQNLELMANSDNVLRGGLTSKHVDINELCQVMRFEAVEPRLLDARWTPDSGTEYPVPVPDFLLREYRLNAGDCLATPENEGPCMWFVLSGEVCLEKSNRFWGAGSAFYQKPGDMACFSAETEAVIYRVSTGFN